MSAGVYFDEERHLYFLDEVQVPSVTGIIGAAGLIEGQEWMTEAARERGRAVHQAVHLHLNGELDEASVAPPLVGYLDAFKRFQREKQPEILASEHQVASRLHGYAGTLDILARMDRVTAVIDTKTGATAPWMGLQLAGYQQACMEQERTAIATRFALKLSSDGTYRLKPFTRRDDLPAFNALVALYHWRKAA